MTHATETVLRRPRSAAAALPIAELIALSVVALGFLLLSAPLLSQPFGRDQGIFATIADAILRGQLPYRDAWDHKPPGIDYAYALAFRLFGRSWQAVHLLEQLVLLGGMVGLWALLRPAGAQAAVAAAALFGAAAILQFEWWDRGQAEMFIAGLSAVGLAALVAGRRWRAVSALVGGAVLGALIWFKPTAAPLTLLGGIILLARSPRSWGTARDLGAYAGGVLALVLVPSGLLLAGGAFAEMWDAVVVFNQLHVQTGANLTLAATAWATVDFFGRMGPLTPLAAAGVIGARRSPALTALLVGWLLAALAGVWSQGKFFSYHWSVALPPLAGLAGSGLIAVWENIRRPGPEVRLRRGAAAILALALLLPVVHEQQAKLGRDLPYLLGKVSDRDYFARFGHNLHDRDVYSFSAARETAAYLAARTTPNDTVLVWGFQALVNWLADRRAPTRYIFSYPLTIERPESPLRRQARDIFLREFDAAPPAYVVLVAKDVNPIQTQESIALIETFPAFKERLARDYVKEREIAEFQIYRRKGPEAVGRSREPGARGGSGAGNLKKG
ncbi:MAG: glycosyltransferase family 39 protein [Chloroflexota bacterium]|nr:glycosyltransferase family 39 protein [Dehalococcoidia bacterium]MDW8254510.1 glycosyltransferase family 39 protein [Chloroflexota bacterium]